MSVPATWAGEVEVKLPAAPGAASADAAGSAESTAFPTTLIWRPTILTSVIRPGQTVGVSGLGFAMQPVLIPLGASAALQVSAMLGPAGYSVAANGTANAAALLLPARYLPQTGDGLEGILPFPPTSLDPTRVAFTCDHPWGALQTCTSLRPAPTGSQKGALVGIGVPAGQQTVRTPSLLAPQSLSPYDRNPPLGTTPAPASVATPSSPHL